MCTIKRFIFTQLNWRAPIIKSETINKDLRFRKTIKLNRNLIVTTERNHQYYRISKPSKYPTKPRKFIPQTTILNAKITIQPITISER